jgi:hypothetical protein
VRLWMRYFKNAWFDCKKNWWKWWTYQVMFKLNFSIPVSKR